MGHVPEDKRSTQMLGSLIDRLKNFKIQSGSIDYSDDYSREWFKTIYHLNRNLKLNRLNITGDLVLSFLRKVSIQIYLSIIQFLPQKYSKIMAEKIVTALHIANMDPLNFTVYLSSIKSNMMSKGPRE